MPSKQLYNKLWSERNLSLIDLITDCLAHGGNFQFPVKKEAFDKAGDRASYAFNLAFENGEVVNNIEGSAVARD